MTKLADELEALAKDATPGPIEYATTGYWRNLRGAGGDILYYTTNDDGVHFDNQADATLILELWNNLATIIAALRQSAAAPDLLNALYQYRDDLRHPPTEDSRERRLEMIARLIAAATDAGS